MNKKFRNILPQVLAVSVKNIVMIGFGMTLGFPTILIPSLRQTRDDSSDQNNNLSLNQEQISWISSINLICAPLGCIFSGSFASLIGRRRAMQLVNVPIFISWIVFYYSQNVYHLYIALCVSGFTGGMLEAPVLTYVAEVSMPKIRGMLSATGSTCVILGTLSQFFMGTFLDWRTITLASSCVPIIAIILLSFVPESPHWLLLKNRKEEAKKSLMWLRGWEKSFDNVKSEFESLERNLNVSKDTAIGRCKDVLEEFSKRTFILPYFIIFLSFFIGHFSGMTTLQTYSVAIFEYFNTPMDKFYATTLLGTLELTGTIFCVILVRYIGKRKLSFISMTGSGLCFFSTAIYAFMFTDSVNNSFFHEKIKTELSQNASTVNFIPANGTSLLSAANESTQYSWIPLALLLASSLLSHSGIRLLPWILIGEVFPAKIRGVCSGLSGGTGYMFGFLANKLFFSMVSSFSLPGTFVFYSCVSFIGCIMLFVLLPETENRTLHEIEDHFSGKKALPKCLKRNCDPLANADPFPEKFDVKSWTSNAKFEEYLKQLEASGNKPSNGKIQMISKNMSLVLTTVPECEASVDTHF